MFSSSSHLEEGDQPWGCVLVTRCPGPRTGWAQRHPQWTFLSAPTPSLNRHKRDVAPEGLALVSEDPRAPLQARPARTGDTQEERQLPAVKVILNSLVRR